MTDLLDRIKNPDTGTLGLVSIGVHYFSGEAILTSLGLRTRQNLIDRWTLIGDEVVQLDAIIAVYQGKPNAAQKGDYLQTIIAGLLVREDGTITKAELETMLEI